MGLKTEARVFDEKKRGKFDESKTDATDNWAVIGTDRKAIAEKARMIASHGQKGKHNHIIEGRNSRLDGLQAAILSAKLPHLDKWTESRIAKSLE